MSQSETENYDWTRFSLDQNVQADAAEVFRLWSTAEGLESFFIKSARFECPETGIRRKSEMVKAGDRYWFEFYECDTEEGTILEVVEGKSIKFTFGGDPASPVVVTVSVGPLAGKPDWRKVELVQENMPDTPRGRHAFHVSCSCGWTFFLLNMRALLDFKVDLRHKLGGGI